ncbi:MAG: hypothetical protein U0795_20175 [Pirellulales bacterium]
MAASVCPQIELVQSSRVSNSGYSTTRLYRVHGAATLDEAEAAVFAQTPASIPANGTLVPERYRIGFEVKGAGQQSGSWEASVEYQAICAPSDITMSFSTGGGTAHITQSLATVASVAASGTAPNFHGAIGVTHDDIEGADIASPDPKYSLTRCYAPGFIDEDVFADLVNLTGKTNSLGWRGLGVREWLFLGADGQSTLYGNDTITFHFTASKTLYNVPVAGMIVPVKRGHDLMWTRYSQSVDGGSNFQVLLPTAVYVERVFHETDFNVEFAPYGI